MAKEEEERAKRLIALEQGGYLDGKALVLEDDKGRFRVYQSENDVPKELKQSIISASDWKKRFYTTDNAEPKGSAYVSDEEMELIEKAKIAQKARILEKENKKVEQDTTKFIDGDTFKVGSESIRFANIDTIETKKSKKFEEQNEQYGYEDEEIEIINEAIKKQQERIGFDNSSSKELGSGKYKRKIVSNKDYEQQMVKDGYASVYTNGKYITKEQENLIELQAEALIKNSGLFDEDMPSSEQMIIERAKAKQDARTKKTSINQKLMSDKEELIVENAKLKQEARKTKKTAGTYDISSRMTYNEAMSWNVVRGIYDVGNTLLGIESTSMEKIKDEIENRLSYESGFDKALADMTQYVPTILAQHPLFKAVGATKNGAKLIDGIMKLVKSKNKLKSYSAIAMLFGLENLSVDAVHGKLDEELSAAESFALGAGFGIGGKFVIDVARVGLKKIGIIQDNINKPSNMKEETPKTTKKETTEDIKKNVDEFKKETSEIKKEPVSRKAYETKVQEAKELGIKTPRKSFDNLDETAKEAVIKKLDDDIKFEQKIQQENTVKQRKLIDDEIKSIDKEIRKVKKENPEGFAYNKEDGSQVILSKKEWNDLGVAYRKIKKGTATSKDRGLVKNHIELVDNETDLFLKKTEFSPNYNIDLPSVNQMMDRKLKLEKRVESITGSSKPEYTQGTLFKEFVSKGSDFKLGRTATYINENTDVKKTMNEVVGSNSPTELVDKIASIADLDKKAPFTLRTTDNLSSAGRYTPSELEDVAINTTQDSQAEALRTIGHEIVHKVSAKYMDKNTKAAINVIANNPRVKTYIKSNSNLTKGKDFEAEFLAEGIIGDAKLVKILKETRSGKGNLYTRLKDFVKKIFNKPNKKTLYDDLDEILTNMDRTKTVDGRSSYYNKNKTNEKGLLEKAAEIGSKADDFLSRKNSKYKAVSDKVSEIYKGITDSTFVKQTKIDWGIGFKNIQKELSKIATLTQNIENQAVQFDNVIKTEFNKYFKGYGKEFRSDIGRAIVNTDLGKTIGNAESRQKILDVLNGSKKLDDLVNEHAKKLGAEKFAKIKAMAEFGVKGTTSDFKVHTNVKQLANEIDVPEEIVQEAATLAALKINGIDNLSKLYKENPKAFKFAAEAARTNIEESGEKLFKGQEHRTMFGYSRDRFSKKNEFIVVDKKDAPLYTTEETKLGWTLGKTIGKSKVLLYRKDLESEFKHGLIPPQKMAVSGELLFEPHVAKNMSEDAMINILKGESIAPTQVVPIRDMNGNIVNFRVMMSKEDRIKFLGLDETIDSQVSNTAQSIVRKHGSKEVNKMLGESLIAKNSNISLERMDSVFLDKDIFEKVRNKDISKEYRQLTEEELSMLPDVYKSQAYVRKDMADVIVGYKEVFMSTPDNRSLRYTEKLWKGLVSEFKMNILKYPVVLANNFLSNNGILLMHGLSPAEMYKYQKQALNGIKEMRMLEKKLMTYKIKRSMNPQRYDKLIKRTEDRLKKNPLTTAKELGFMQSITEEVFVDGMKTDNLFREEVKAMFVKSTENKIGSKAKDIANRYMKDEAGMEKLFNEVYGGEGSYMWKQVTNAMQYGDYMARWALYNKKLSQGFSKTEAAEIAQKRFVDYRKNLPKVVQTISEYGFAPFATFAYRIQPELVKMANEEPTKVATSILMMHLFGGATEDSIRTDSWNIYGSFMDFGAFQANPLDNNMVVPMPYEVIWNGISDGDATEFLKLIGVSVR